MRRVLPVIFCLFATAAPALTAAAAAPARASVVVLWAPAGPRSSLADVRCMDVALRAPFEIGAPVRSLGAHPRARFAIALSPAYANALACADGAEDPLGAAWQATGERADVRTRDTLALLANLPALTEADAQLAGIRELTAIAVTARRAAAGEIHAVVSRDDLRRGAAFAALARLASLGESGARTALARPPAATTALHRTADVLLRADLLAVSRGAADQSRRAALEFVAAPDGDPVLPLLVDSGGKTMADPDTLALNASADASMFIDDALTSAGQRNAGHGAGLLAPFGAYDDASAQLIAARGARFAIFSDRVLQTSQAGGSAAALQDARAASYRVYALQTGKTSTLPVFFWNDGASLALTSLAPTTPAGAFAARVSADAGAAAATSLDGSPRVLVLRVPTQGSWARRPDAAAVVDAVAASLARSGISATPTEAMRGSARSTSAYGFAPGSSLGSLDVFTASQNQAAMWSALAAARAAAGGDAALGDPARRDLLLRAEAGDWYLAPALPLPPDRVKARIDGFRALISALYAAAGKAAPATIAPMRTPTPAAVPPTPSPAPSPHLSTGPVNMWRTRV